MTMLRVAVIGCGSWGRNHARVYKELPGIKLVAVSDVNPTTAREIGEKYRVKGYTEPSKILKDPNVELVSICTPTITHSEIALKAIEAGKHVLVEKPMTDTLEQAKTLIKATERQNVHLTVGFVERFNPAVQEAYRLIGNGEIGDVILAHTRRVNRSPGRIGDVGVVKDLAIHDIDIVNHLFTDEAESVYAITGSIAHKYEDYANINIGYTRNRTVFVEANWLTPRRIRTMNVTGTEGIISVDYTSQQITIENNQRLTQPYLPYAEPLRLELESFTSSVIRDTHPIVTGWDGLRALQICEAALKSSRTGKRIKLTSI